MRPAASSVDAYLAGVESEAARASLEALRALIRDAAPEAEEVISYGIPTYKFHGMVCSFAAFKNHCSFFPGHTLDDYLDQVKEFKTSRGTVQFSPEKPIPDNVVRAMVHARVTANLAKARQ